MGIDLLAPCLAMPKDRAPDWDAAARYIADLCPEVVIGAGELFPIEAWLEDGSALSEGPTTQGHAIALAARSSLTGAASKVRAALENPAAAELIVIELPYQWVYAACSLDAMAEDFDLTNSFTLLGESGVAQAAGFDHWTQFAPPIEERNPGSWLTAEELEAPSSAVVAIEVGEVEPAGVGRDSIAWIATIESSWPQAEAFIRDSGLPDDLDEELEVLWGYVLDDYGRMIVPERVCGIDILIVADCDNFGERAASFIESLGDAGVLDPGAFIGWEGRGGRAGSRRSA